MKATWKKNPGAANELLSGKGFYVSYNPCPSKDPNPLKRAELAMIGSFVSIVGGGHSNDEQETALYTKRDDKFRILVGDFRDEYAEAFKDGIKACLAVYEKHKAKHDSDWSTK